MAPHSSTLAWKIPWMEEPGRLQSMGSLRVGHDWVLHFPFSLSCIGEGNGNPLQCSCLENPRDGGAWWAAVYGVAQSQTRLKRLSSSIEECEEKVIFKKVSHGNSSVHFSSVQSLIWVQLCNHIDCSMPGFPVHHQLWELTQTQVHWVSDDIQPSHPLFPPCPFAFNLSHH